MTVYQTNDITQGTDNTIYEYIGTNVITFSEQIICSNLKIEITSNILGNLQVSTIYKSSGSGGGGGNSSLTSSGNSLFSLYLGSKSSINASLS